MKKKMKLRMKEQETKGKERRIWRKNVKEGKEKNEVRNERRKDEGNEIFMRICSQRKCIKMEER